MEDNIDFLAMRRTFCLPGQKKEKEKKKKHFGLLRYFKNKQLFFQSSLGHEKRGLKNCFGTKIV